MRFYDSNDLFVKNEWKYTLILKHIFCKNQANEYTRKKSASIFFWGVGSIPSKRLYFL